MVKYMGLASFVGVCMGIFALMYFHKNPDMIAGYYESCLYVLVAILYIFWGFALLAMFSGHPEEEEPQMTQEDVAWRFIAFVTFPVSIPLCIFIEWIKWWKSLPPK